jgi:peptide/nickel transport system ATP-binding protein
MNQPLLSVKDLSLEFIGARKIHALNSLSFDVVAGEVLVLLGESGSGKSVTLRSLLHLYGDHEARVSGEILINGQNVLAMNNERLNQYRGAEVSMVFQEAGSAFDPVYTIGQQIVEFIMAHEAVGKDDAMKRALELLEMVKIPQAKQRLFTYPHELSGGMRQRAMIALALACRPSILLADEPTTALDATVQIQVLLLLRELQKEFNMAVIFVTHDIGAAVEIADNIAVMYAGNIIEQGGVRKIVRTPSHPYSAGLLASTVNGNLKGQRLLAIPGSPPNMGDNLVGCAFAPRCSRAEQGCYEAKPSLIAGAEGKVACWQPL